ncbi:MAG: CDP-diacylglycerol--glycerol-3-phosphate 3-phosphatidyltransferase [Elusimicrobiota bacterium]
MTVLNIANKITLIRVVLIPFFIICLLIPGFVYTVAALIIFVICSLTDSFDGMLARKYNLVSTFGKFVDPLADKLLVSSAFVSFIAIDQLSVPAWMVIIILAREFIITGMRGLAATSGRVIAADTSGKVKTTVQMIVIILILTVLCVLSGIKYGMFDTGIDYDRAVVIAKNVGFYSVALTVVVTIYSGIDYLVKHRDLFL